MPLMINKKDNKKKENDNNNFKEKEFSIYKDKTVVGKWWKTMIKNWNKDNSKAICYKESVLRELQTAMGINL